MKLVALGATKAVVEGRPVSVWYTMNQSSWVWPWNCAVTVASNLTSTVFNILTSSLSRPRPGPRRFHNHGEGPR